MSIEDMTSETPDRDNSMAPATELIDELALLKQRADLMGIKYSGNIGIDKLRAKIEEKKIAPVDAPVVNVPFANEEAETIQAFDDMCASDILITGTSGFSHLASIFCRTPVVLAMPFWHSYDYIPNAMNLQIGKGNYTLPNMANKTPFTFTNSARFNDSQFDLLWQTLNEDHI